MLSGLRLNPDPSLGIRRLSRPEVTIAARV